MDREALIAELRGRVEQSRCGDPCICSDCGPLDEAVETLASDAKLLEELKGLCDDVDPRGIGLAGLVSEIRAIFGWTPSPSQSNTLDLPPCSVCGEKLVTRYSGPLPGCPQGISTAVCPTDPSHAAKPPQASPSNEVTPEKIRVRLFQEVGGWSVTCNGHADEHVCLAASTLFNAVCAGLTTLATVYPDQIEIIEATDEPSPSHDCADKGHKGDCPHFYLYPD